jgi:hypothetical protein
MLVDIMGSWFFVWPFVINNICSIIAGAFAHTELYTAEVFTRLLYGFWFLHNTSFSCVVLYAGYRLVRILNGHLAKFDQTGSRYAAVKMGIFKIKMIVTIIINCLMMFATFLLLYGILRDLIMVNVPGSVFLAVVWTYLGPLATAAVELAILINPKFEKNAALFAGSSANGTSGGAVGQSTYEANTSFAGDTSFHKYEDNISQQQNSYASNELKQQQAQYQQVFQRHATGHTASMPPRDLDYYGTRATAEKYQEHYDDDSTTPTTPRQGVHRRDDDESSKLELTMYDN